MIVLKVSAIALMSVFAMIITKSFGKEQQTTIMIGCFCMLAHEGLELISQIFNEAAYLQVALQNDSLIRLRKAIGISLVAEICAGLCKQMGAEQIGGVVEWVAKLEILLLSLPLVKELLALASAFTG